MWLVAFLLPVFSCIFLPISLTNLSPLNYYLDKNMAFKVHLGFEKNYIFFFQIINLVVFICVMSSGVYWRETTTAEWTDFVAMTGFWVTGILLIFYLLHVIEKFHVIPWMTIEMGFTILWAFFYLTCSIDLAINASKNGPHAFAGKLRLFCTYAYFLEWST